MGGRSTTSVLNLPQFRVKWKDVTRVSRDVTTGMTEKEAAAISRSDKPILVFVYDDEAGQSEESPRFAIEQAAAFADDKVAIGARYFECVRIDAESAKADHALKEHVGTANSLLFVRPNYEVAGTLHFKDMKVQARKVFAEMCATLRVDYENCVKSACSDMKKLQKERVKLDREQAEVRELDAKIADEPSAKRREKLMAERDEVQGKLDKEYEKLHAEETRIFALAPRESKQTS